MPLTDETRERAREIIARYPKSRSALLPMLHLVQAEEGYVTAEGIALCAEELGLTKAEVGAVATFYTMYKRKPTGDWLVSVCTNLSCQLLGGDEIFARLSRDLGVGHDETTDDGTITLEHAECLAACDYAPVVTVNYEFFDNQTPETAADIVSALQRGDRPTPTRGETLVPFQDISRELAGFVPQAVVREAVAEGKPVAHPVPPAPTDSRGTVDTTGTDVGPHEGDADYGVAGGVTERVLSDEAASSTYGPAGEADAGADRSGEAEPKLTRRGKGTRNNPATAGHLPDDQEDE